MIMITTSKSYKLTTENFKARLAQANLVTKADFDTKLQSLNKQINLNKTKHLLVGNLKDCHMKRSGLLIQQIKVFLQTGMLSF